MFRILRLRLYPTRLQRTRLEAHLEACRQLYNAAVEERRLRARVGLTTGRYDQQVQIPLLKRSLPQLQAVSSIVLQDVTARVHAAHVRYARGITGPPRYKKPGRYVSLSYSAHRRGNYYWQGNQIFLGRLASIRCRMKGRPAWFLRAKPKGCTIKRVGNRWYAYVRFEASPPSRPQLPSPCLVLGLDMGVEHFAVTSGGEFLPNLHSFSRRERRIKRLQRRYDRRIIGSKNREKGHAAVARLFERARDERLDNHHQISRRLAQQTPFVAVESNITGLRRGMFRKQIYDVGWGQFLRFLEYKLVERGGALLRVSRDNTSQRCSRCRTLVPKPLKQRQHQCPACGLSIHRDLNAALNIQQLGLLQLPREPGEVTPAEIGSHRAHGSVPVKEAGISAL